MLRWFGRVSHYGSRITNIPGYYRSRADDRAIADIDAWKDDSAGANEGEITNGHFSGKPCSWGDVHTIANDAIVVDGCGRINNHGIT